MYRVTICDGVAEAKADITKYEDAVAAAEATLNAFQCCEGRIIIWIQDLDDRKSYGQVHVFHRATGKRA
jgi:hypothetical protein